MGKLIAAINMTLDGFCDHTSMIADEEILQHYTELLSNAGHIVYGRKTFHLMTYWRTVLDNPTGNKAMDQFAAVMDRISKIVFSRTLKNLEWESAMLARAGIEEEILALKKKTGKDILIGSPGLIVTATNLGLIDEFQICVHPVIAGRGMPLFNNLTERINLKPLKTETFGCGAVILYYEPVEKIATKHL